MKISLLGLTVLILVGCSSSQRLPGQTGVIVDTKGIDLNVYESDLDECHAFADEVRVAEKAGVGAAAGAAVGAVFGAAVGNSRTVERGAGAGAVGGAVKGTASGLSERDRVVKRCLQGRGYSVLN